MERRRDEPPGRIVLLDGLFGGTQAVTPMECRELIRRGWQLYGASSIGALRAAELWSEGMLGVGNVYLALRTGLVLADDELAVAYHPDSHEELTASLVHIRALCSGLVQPSELETVLKIARQVYWRERRWRDLFDRWQQAGIRESTVDEIRSRYKDPRYHPKACDGRTAVQLALATVWPSQQSNER